MKKQFTIKRISQMPQIFLFATALFFSIFTASAQNFDWGIGLRFGDPSGLTFKKYTGSNAFEINIGRTNFFRNARWYDDRFKDWYEEEKFGYHDVDYVRYRGGTPISIQVHYLWQQDIGGVDGLQWYYGLGGQLKYITYHYRYRYKEEKWSEWRYTDHRVTDFDIGVDGVIGLEYIIPSSPVSLFVDFTAFLEIIDNPFALWGQGGIGGRINF